MGNKYIMRNCYWCNEYRDMNATVPTCDYYGQYGSCPCSDECEHYISEPEVENIIRKRVETGHSHEDGQWFDLTDALTVERIDWIPCSERLPSEYAQYLVCLESGECYVYWLEDSNWARGMAEKEGIIAWMPLPEPYKGGGSE